LRCNLSHFLKRSGTLLMRSPVIIFYFIKLNTHLLFNKLTKRKNVIFDINYVGSIQYVIPVINEITRRDLKIAVFISYGDKKIIRALPQLPANCFFPDFLIKYIEFCDIFISPTQWANCPKKGLKICMFHGQPSKNITFISDLIKNFDVLFFVGPLLNEFFELTFASQWRQSNKIRTYNVGYPKSDNLYNNIYTKSKVLRSLNLNEKKTTVIYAPSYEEGTSLREFGEDVIQQLVSLDINVLVKLHPVSLSPEGDPSGTKNIDWIGKLKKFEKFNNYRFLNTNLIDPYLIASDIMITDVSSVAFEFMGLDRPIIYFDSPKFYEKYLVDQFNLDPQSVKDNLFCNAGRHAGLIISTPEELKSAIFRSISNPFEFSSKRKEISKKLLYNPGNATIIAVDTIMDLMKMER